MAYDPVDLAAQLAPVGPGQAVDLLRQVLPVERLVRAAPRRGPQSLGLLLGPGNEILVVQGLRFRHRPSSFSRTYLRHLIRENGLGRYSAAYEPASAPRNSRYSARIARAEASAVGHSFAI